ncbi:MAG: OmpA family protein [Gammaproteobacteria bacterium]|nr:OmpA family protein [Gammaproteobacteria bacterium]
MTRFSLVIVGVLLLTACTTNPYTGEREASNKAKAAGIGAAIGAVIGALTGDDADDRRKRALIGLGVGGLAGTAVGAYMDAQESKLRQQLQGSGVSVTRMGNDLILNMPGNVTFDVARTDLRGDFIPVLDSVSLVLKEFEQTLIDVTGHTDSTGSIEYNMDLSNRRAQSVATYLKGTGVERARVETLGVGPHYPVAENSTAQGRQLNRRVELVLKPLT